MASKTSIANGALIHCGVSKLLTNVDSDTSKEAKTIKAVYDNERDQVLSDFRWPFAKRSVDLGLVGGTTTEAYDLKWQYAYRYPADCLDAHEIVSTLGRTDPDPIQFDIGSDATGRLILTDEPEAVLQYTTRITNEGQFDALFVAAFQRKLASVIAPALSRVKDIEAHNIEMYHLELSKAERRALMEAQKDPEPDAELIRARS